MEGPPTTSRRDPVQQRARDRREAILRATEAVIIEQGVDALTPTRIAEVAGITPSAIYTYFENTDDILRDYLQREIHTIGGAIADAVVALERVSLRSLFAAVAGAYVAYFRTHPKTIALWLGGRRNAMVLEAVTDQRDRHGAFLYAALLRAGLFKEGTPPWSAQLAVRDFDATAEYVFCRPHSEAEQAEMIDSFIEMVSGFSERTYATKRGIEGIPRDEFLELVTGSADIGAPDFWKAALESLRQPPRR